ncbi:cation:proton antiporter domain-containing protein [Novosphingobium aquimarinum]|uniref:cation:proton antiporter domain-containing protein n=1 Tax=Novosphingobium aquimarinum TaxID=2682494 RepID=UPI0012EB6AE0|nr:cation:proton antiporter [Novosphingobium aquimarinum]
MEEHAQAFLLRDGFFLFGAALGFVLIFRRFGLGATLGYLAAGALMGPHALGLVGDAEGKAGFAELGITLLLFIVGLELAPRRLWRMRHEIFGLGLLQVTTCGLAVSAVIWATTGFTLTASLALGLPLGLSSTAQVLPMLQSAGRLHTPFGERAFSILLFQDLSIIPLVTIIAAMSRNPAAAEGPPGWMLVIYTVAAIAGLIAAGRFVIRPLFRLIGNLGEREMFIFAALFTVIASAALMQALGLSSALGAFIAGVMLADTPYRHELEADVEPFRSILLGLFFISVGMMLDLSAIAERPLFVLAMAAALIVTKSVVIFILARLFRANWREALALGLLLSQGGEFGFVLFAQATNAFLIDPEVASLFGAIVTLSMVTTPFLMMATRRIRQAPAGQETRAEPQDDGAGALIVGYGRFGQTVAQMLIASGIEVTLIDTDVEMIDVAENFGAKVYFGDGTRLDMLRQAGAGEAEVIAFCLDGDQVSEEFLAAVHKAFPRAQIYVRAFDRRSVLRLKGAPVNGVVREVLESAVVLARTALDGLGLAIEDIDKAESDYRSRDRERLKLQHEAGDLHEGRDRIFTQPEGSA